MTLLNAGPSIVKAAALLVVGGIIVGLAGGAVPGADPAASAMMLLLAVMASAVILGQQPTRQAWLSISATLVILGLSLAALSGVWPERVLILGVLAVPALLLVRNRPDAVAWGAIAGLAAGFLALAGSLVTSGSTAIVLQIVGCAALLPLFPLQGAFVGSLSRLPGALPAFVAVVFPCLGWHGLATLADTAALPGKGLLALALVGALYEALRAFAQFHVSRMIASITALLLSLVWWQIAATGAPAPETLAYLCAVTLAASGVLMAGHLLEARYGVLDLDTLRGLATPMPRLSLLVALLLMAAMGLPLFGIFPTFLAMIVAASSSMPYSLAAVLAIWLAASLLLMKLLQRLLFGHPKPDMPYGDLTWAELAPLALVLALLILAVRVPAPPESPPTQAQAAAAIEERP
jgi:NADH-quinone oxidoreductase subunit M